MKKLNTYLKKIIFVLGLLFSLSMFSQNSTGLLLMPEADYINLPKANWPALKTFSTGTVQTTRAANAVVMLDAPVSGNQLTQGSCVGWALGYSAMGILTYPKTLCWNSAKRSPNYVYNQIKINSSCSSGSYMVTGLNLLKNKGDCSWNLMPYNNSDCSTQPNATQDNDAAQNKAINWTTLLRNDSNGIKDALDLGFPVVVGFQVTTAFDSMWNSGGNWTTNSGTSRGGHAVCIVGYDETKQMFKVQNQWGSGGSNGFFWVTYNLVNNNCFSEVYIVYGASPALKPVINGASFACSGTNSGIYKVDNMPTTGASVVWSASPANAVTISSPTATQTTVTKLNGGAFILTATITYTCAGATPLVLTKSSYFSSVSTAATNLNATRWSYGYYITFTPAPGTCGYWMEAVDLTTNTTYTTNPACTPTTPQNNGNFFYYIPLDHSFKFRLIYDYNCAATYSDWKTITADPCPNYPTNLVLYPQSSGSTPSASGAIVNWTSVSTASAGYQVEYLIYNLAGQSKTGTFTCSSNSFTFNDNVSGLGSGPWYVKFKVRSRCNYVLNSEYSPWSATYNW